MSTEKKLLGSVEYQINVNDEWIPAEQAYPDLIPGHQYPYGAPGVGFSNSMIKRAALPSRELDQKISAWASNTILKLLFSDLTQQAATTILAEHENELQINFNDASVKYYALPYLLVFLQNFNKNIQQQNDPNMSQLKERIPTAAGIVTRYFIELGAQYKPLILLVDHDISPQPKPDIPVIMSYDTMINLLSRDYLFECELAGYWLRLALGSIDKLKPALASAANRGLPLSLSNNENGTFLHAVLANEEFSVFLDSLKVVCDLTQTNDAEFDFCHQDGEGKTLLMLACKLRHYASVMRLIQTKADIGINIPDQQGRTPIMVATALGCKEIVDLLKANGADLSMKDNKGRDVSWYNQCSEEEVEHILREIHVHPERHQFAPHNWLYWPDGSNTPMTHEHSTSEANMVLISPLPQHMEIISAVQRELGRDPNDQKAMIALQYVNKVQLTSLTRGNKTVLQACMENKLAMKDYFKNMQTANPGTLSAVNFWENRAVKKDTSQVRSDESFRL